MAKKCMLTTIDNPFDPFEQFTSWLLFDAVSYTHLRAHETLIHLVSW